jgi:hypothetical protein
MEKAAAFAFPAKLDASNDSVSVSVSRIRLYPLTRLRDAIKNTPMPVATANVAEPSRKNIKSKAISLTRLSLGLVPVLRPFQGLGGSQSSSRACYLLKLYNFGHVSAMHASTYQAKFCTIRL